MKSPRSYTSATLPTAGSRAHSRLAGLLIVVLSWLAVPTADASSIELAGNKPYSLAGHCETLVDPGGGLTLKDILTGNAATRFTTIPGFVNLGYTSGASWTRFSLSRSRSFPRDVLLRLGPSMLDHVTVYVQVGDDPSAAGSYREFVFGDRHPVTERPVRHSSFVAPIVLTAGNPKLVYVRVLTTSTHHLKGWVYPPEEFIFWSELQSLFTGGFLGICLVVALINMIFALRLRDMLYGHYSLYVLTHLAGAMGMEGILPLFWPAGAHLVSDYLAGGGITLGFSTFALFAVRLFETRGNRPIAHLYFLATFFFGLAGFFAIPLGLYERVAPLLAANGLLFVPFLTWLGIELIRRGAPAGKLFLTAFMVSNIAGILAFMRLLGVAPVNWVTLYSLPIGTVLSMVLMTLALTERLHAAEKKALAASREAEQKAVVLAGEMTRELVEKQRDLEDALAAEREALESQVRFVEMVSHEYRTPLAIIRANLDILEMKACKADCVLSPNLGKIKRAVARLVEVLEVSLGRERLDDAHLKMSREAIPVAAFIRELVRETKELWTERRLELDHGDTDGSTVTGDRSLLKTAFLNLVDNALKYSAEGEPVSISVRAGEGEAIVMVRDRGRGIPASELDRVFEKFYRGTGSADTRGAGVGLYLVRRIVEQHGGKVSLAGGDQGGTVATVKLPLSHQGG